MCLWPEEMVVEGRFKNNFLDGFQTPAQQTQAGRRSEASGMAAAAAPALLQRHVGPEPGHPEGFGRSGSRRYFPAEKFRR